MAFERLPEEVFRRILGFLPLKDQVRVGLVNKSFYATSQLVISETAKSINLARPEFRNLNQDQFRRLMTLCSNKLERIKLRDYDIEQMAAFLEFAFPRLTSLHVGYTDAGNDTLEQVMAKYPNLRSFVWLTDTALPGPIFVEYPSNYMNDSLEELDIAYCDNESIESITECFPNLKNLKMIAMNVDLDILDWFFASVPQLERVRLIGGLEG